jgi:hypothetical protein
MTRNAHFILLSTLFCTASMVPVQSDVHIPLCKTITPQEAMLNRVVVPLQKGIRQNQILSNGYENDARACSGTSKLLFICAGLLSAIAVYFQQKEVAFITGGSVGAVGLAMYELSNYCEKQKNITDEKIKTQERQLQQLLNSK